MQGMPRGLSLFEEAKDLYVELCSNSEFNPVLVSVMKEKKKKKATTQTSLNHYFKRVGRIESSRKPEPVSSMSGMSKIAACLLIPIADSPSALASPTSFPSSRQ